MYKLRPEEVVLADDYPVYVGLVYIMDNRLIRSEITATVGTLKGITGASEVRRCELFKHQGARIGDLFYSEYYKI